MRVYGSFAFALIIGLFSLSACGPAGNPMRAPNSSQNDDPSSTTTTTTSSSTSSSSSSSSSSSTTTTLSPGGCQAFLCFEKNGRFFKSTEGTPGTKFRFNKQGHYTKLHVEIDIFIPHWHAGMENAIYPVFWITKSGWRSLLGYPILRGPSKNLAKVSWGIGMDASSKYNVSKSFVTPLNTTLHFEYDYDVLSGTITYVITKQDGSKLQMTGNQGVISFDVGPGDYVEIAMGQELPATGPEGPTYDWEYSNLILELN